MNRTIYLFVCLSLVACGKSDPDSMDSPDPQTPSTAIPPNQNSGLNQRPDNNSCIAPATASQPATSVDLTPAFLNLGGLSRLLGIYQQPQNSNYWYAILQAGQVVRFDNNPSAASLTTVLDISSSVDSGPNEAGLLGLAFHPDFANNHYVYLSYNIGSPLRSRISRFTFTNDASIDPQSETVLLTVNQPYGNHNGGHIAFGADGYLYIGLGDGGSAGDPQGHSQNTQTLLGNMLRIDVDNGTPYSIPADNPFANNQNGLAEIYAWGLRNPWRWSFDRLNDSLWLGDVGQGEWEEIDIITHGGNYGWKIMEGNHCYNSSSCNQNNLTLPVFEYQHTNGRCSITGGYVYRGSNIAGLQGTYIYGDYCSREIWGLTPSTNNYSNTILANASANISSFAEDNQGELYALVLYPIAAGYSIFRLDPSNGNPNPSNIPQQLSQSGCFQSNNPSQAESGLIPFDVASPLWSDGTTKERFMALPNGSNIGLSNTGDFDFPTGTILAKHFILNDKYIETRLFMHHQTGWAGYSYEWDDAQTDASLLTTSKDKVIDGQTWHYPSGIECLQCHTSITNFALGPETRQLNYDYTYNSTGITANQITTLSAINLFDNSPSGSLLTEQFYALTDLSINLEQRAKSYLHSNCSQCHRPNGVGSGNLDLRFETTFTDMGLCNVIPNNTLGINNARIIAPGDPNRSVLLQRMLTLDSNRMPPLASSIVDTDATNLISDWILTMSGC